MSLKYEPVAEPLHISVMQMQRGGRGGKGCGLLQGGVWGLGYKVGNTGLKV